MLVSSRSYYEVNLFMDDLYLKEKGGKFLADIDFSFNAHRKIAEGWVTISEDLPGDIILSISCLNCDPSNYPMLLDGTHREEFYYQNSCLLISGHYNNKNIGKFRICIKPKETTW